jgi:hypothetical protein
MATDLHHGAQSSNTMLKRGMSPLTMSQMPNNSIAKFLIGFICKFLQGGQSLGVAVGLAARTRQDLPRNRLGWTGAREKPGPEHLWLRVHVSVYDDSATRLSFAN